MGVFMKQREVAPSAYEERRQANIARLCELLRTFEGCSLHVYRCSGGKATAGYGSTRTLGNRPFRMGQTITRDMAERLLLRDAAKAYDQAERALPAIATDGAKVGWGSFVYNLGVGNMKKSKALRAFRARQTETFKREFLEWRKASGKVLRGLEKRRRKELEVILGDGKC